jgi:hypothetical protein
MTSTRPARSCSKRISLCGTHCRCGQRRPAFSDVHNRKRALRIYRNTISHRGRGNRRLGANRSEADECVLPRRRLASNQPSYPHQCCSRKIVSPRSGEGVTPATFCHRSMNKVSYLPLSMCHPGFIHSPLRSTKTSVTRPDWLKRWPPVSSS